MPEPLMNLVSSRALSSEILVHGHSRYRSLEVEPGLNLPDRLVEGVLHLVLVDFGDDVEGELVPGHAANLADQGPMLSWLFAGGCPSGQRERSVKSPA